MILLTAAIDSRYRFGELLNQKRLLSKAVEIGTHRGTFAEKFLMQWSEGTYYGIDPWDNVPPDFVDQLQYLEGGGKDRAGDYTNARIALRPWTLRSRAELIKATSAEAVTRFKDGSLDFVYIDGDHSYKHVCEDLALYYPKLHSGGIMAGHDFMCPWEIKGGWAQFIQPAVFEFCNKHAIQFVQLVVERDGSPYSFYFEKP
jgi:hypothetical protein